MVAPDIQSSERKFKRAFASWPTFVNDSQQAAWQAWQELSQEQREKAAEEIERYIEACKSGKAKRCAFGVYLREKRWEDLPEESPETPSDYAPPFGPVWSAFVVGALLRDDLAPVEALYNLARIRRGYRFGDRWHALKPQMEAVPINTERMNDWRSEYERRGWPWLPSSGAQPVVYFPKGGPVGLAAFECAIDALEMGT